MPNINLKAKLQAYSKAPFYGDYIRQPESLLPNYDPSVVYVLKDGSWIDLAKAASDTGASIDDLKAYIQLVESRVRSNIRIEQDLVKDPSTFLFYDYNNQPTAIKLPDANVDNITVGINDDSQLYTINNPDEITLKTIVTYTGDSENIEESFDIKRDGKYQVIAINSKDDPTERMTSEEKKDFSDNYISGYSIRSRLESIEKNVRDLESYTQGTGGFLDPVALGNLVQSSIEERNNILNQYAYSQLSNGEEKLIPDQTKVKNTFDGHIWVYVQADDNWLDEGADTIVTANNEGVLGAVTGVAYDPSNLNTKFKISIDMDKTETYSIGTMSVNGLQEEFDQVIYRTETDKEVTSDTYVQRTEQGTIKASASIEDNDVITQEQFNAWIDEQSITADDIHSLFPEIYGGNN